MDLLASRLCDAASTAQPALLTLFEQILSDIGHYDAQRLIAILTPYAASDAAGVQRVYPSHVRLMALHVICATIHFLPSHQLLEEMNTLVPSIIHSVSSAVVDVRKAVIFVFVEIFLTVGDALFPYLTELTASQRKLLTIYIEKKMAHRNEALIK